jgi:hypothetical protein
VPAITTRSPLPRRALGPGPVTAPETVVTYVVITPAGELLTRTADGHVVVDEWDSPYQESLWSAVHFDVDPLRGEVNGVALDAGLRAKVADAAMPDPMRPGPPEQYPPNPVASAMLTALGHAPVRWFGVIALVGTEDDEGITASLTSEQLDIVARVHREATAR